MPSGAARVPLLIAVIVAVTLLYPALFLGYRVAPEASLRNLPPWQSLWGPYPNPSPEAVHAATHLGPRLAMIARDGAAGAVWDQWVGGGRPGWLAGAAEGGAPLPVAAALLAARGWAWTALVAVEIVAALLATWWVLRLAGLGPWPAAVGATIYALSGAVAGAWLNWRGSALALGPLALAPALARASGRKGVAAWAVVLALLLAGGAPALAFVALALVLVVLAAPPHRLATWGAALAAVVVVVALATPRIWLERAGREPGAPESSQRPSPPIAGWSALLEPTSAHVAGGVAPAQGVGNPAYVGLAALLLAATGVLLAPSRERGIWVGVAAASAALAAVPAAALVRIGLTQRPFGVLALAVAVLAAYGAQGLAARWPARSAAVRLTGGLLWGVVALALLPGAARRLPFAPADESGLGRPLAPARPGAPDRSAALLGAMPPDVGATLAIADVRAASLAGEPRYASLLGAAPNGELSVSRALDIETARLGARYLIEPLPARVVSGEIFSRTVPAELTAGPEPGRFGVVVPLLATRLGLAAPLPGGTLVFLTTRSGTIELEADAALRSESADWRWFTVPPAVPSGPASVELTTRLGPLRTAPGAAWDASGLRLAADDERGVRLWEWDAARPIAFLARGFRPDGRSVPADPRIVTVAADRVAPLAARTGTGRVVTSARADRLEATVRCERPAFLVAQLKFRPALWRATVDGKPVATERVDGVWTGVPVPAGTSRVDLEAALPAWTWALTSAGLAAVALAAWPRRRS
jgi:hypothetical protein